MSWMKEFGWKKKAEHLRMVILSAGHQNAKALSPAYLRILALFREAAKTGVASHLHDEMQQLGPTITDADRPLYEPIEARGWKIEATMYLDNGQLYWLLHAARRNENAPSELDVATLTKILEHLGADVKRDMIIGPSSSPAGEPALPFGWWTWFNRAPLYEVQVNKNKQRPKDMMRIVPLGAPESDGYTRVDLTTPT